MTGVMAVPVLELSPPEKAVVQKIARKVVQWNATVPAIMFLEVHRPLSFVASQMLHMATPFVSMFLDATEFTVLAKMLERRETIEEIIVAIEEADSRAEDARRSGKSGGKQS